MIALIVVLLGYVSYSELGNMSYHAHIFVGYATAYSARRHTTSLILVQGMISGRNLIIPNKLHVYFFKV